MDTNSDADPSNIQGALEDMFTVIKLDPRLEIATKVSTVRVGLSSVKVRVTTSKKSPQVEVRVGMSTITREVTG